MEMSWKNFSTLSAAVLSVLIATRAHAIINIEAVRLRHQNPGWVGAVGIAYDRREGNVDQWRLKANSQILYRGQFSETIAFIENETGKNRRRTDVNRSVAHARYVHGIQGPLAGEIFTQYESNEFVRLRFRGLVGTGGRWRIYHHDATAIYAGFGGFWVRENIARRFGTQDPDVLEQARGNAYLSVQFPLSSTIKLRNVSYYQPRVDDTRDVQGLAESQLEFQVTRNVAWVWFYNITYDSRPPEQVRTQDQNYGSQLNITF